MGARPAVKQQIEPRWTGKDRQGKIQVTEWKITLNYAWNIHPCFFFYIWPFDHGMKEFMPLGYNLALISMY